MTAPPAPPAPKHVFVVLRRPPAHPRTAQGLRSALGYATADLRVTVVLCGAAQAMLDAQDPAKVAPPHERAVRTLRALGHTVCIAPAEPALARMLCRADAIVTW